MWFARVGMSRFFPRACFGTGVLALSSALVIKREDDIDWQNAAKLSEKGWYIAGPFKDKDNRIIVSRRVTTKFDKTGLKLRMYQYEACPFCCKVRAFLNYYGFSYDVIEVRPLTRKELKPLKDVKKLPTVLAEDDRRLSDSSLIISILASYLNNKNKSLEEVVEMYPEKAIMDPRKGEEIVTCPNMYEIMRDKRRLSATDLENARKEIEWRKWVDDHFIHLIVPNVYRTWNECIGMFRWFGEAGQWDKVVPAWERYATIYIGSFIMFIMSKKLRKKYEDADVRELLIQSCNEWMAAVGSAPFLGGSEPNLADLALYGAMNSFMGSKSFEEICSKTEIKTWFDRVKKAVDLKAGAALLQQRPAITA